MISLGINRSRVVGIGLSNRYRSRRAGTETSMVLEPEALSGSTGSGAGSVWESCIP